MTNEAPSPLVAASELPDRVKLALTLDVARMREEVLAMPLHDFIHYSVLPLTAPAHFVDPSRPAPPPAKDHADGSWTDWLDTSLLRSSAYLASVVAGFRAHTDVTLVRLLRLASGGVVKEHTDPTLGLEVERSVIRLTVPIITNEHCRFFLSGREVPWKPGECWYLRFADPHSAVNEGAQERIHMSIDVIPNAWVRELVRTGIAEPAPS